MEATRDQNYEQRPYGTTRLEMIEMHLFDDDSAEEEPLCEVIVPRRLHQERDVLPRGPLARRWGRHRL